MNCKEFESTLNDTAREALNDAAGRAAAEAHAADCEPCAALLSDARALTAGLRALSSQAAGAAAPPRVEAHLLAAFRAQRAAGTPAFVAPAPENAPAVVIPFAAKRWSWWKTFGAAGLAAAAAVALVVLVPQMLTGPRTPTTYQADSRQPSQTNVEQPPQAGIIVPPETLVAAGAQGEPIEKEQTPPVAVNTPRASRAATMTSVKYNGGGTTRNNEARAAASTASAGERAEITTDFIPLAQGGGFFAGEGGHVVRVELPRSALARFGLPVNAEASEGRVKADVLIGDDGMARAIRFVR